MKVVLPVVATGGDCGCGDGAGDRAGTGDGSGDAGDEVRILTSSVGVVPDVEMLSESEMMFRYSMSHCLGDVVVVVVVEEVVE